MFEVGRQYYRKEVSAKIGGELISYLTTSEGGTRVNAGFFNLKLDPLAPTQVQVGRKINTIRKAEILMHQSDKRIFIFTKKKRNDRFSYVGEFELSGVTTNATEILEAERMSGRVGGVTMLLTFVNRHKESKFSL